MKKSLLILTMMTMAMASCTNEVEDLVQKESFTSAEETQLATRACSNDTADLGELVCLKDTGELHNLRLRYEEMMTNMRKVQAVNAMYDELFTSNIYAIRELPITIQVRSVATGSNAAYSHLYCAGAGKEVTLTSSSTASGNKFYLKILPATSGIPYLIYSNVSKTPLTIGHYNNNPTKKLLMSQVNDSKLSDFASWDLIASSYKGYFAIQNCLYLGQTDPNDMWSVFNYTLEAKTNNQLGFEKAHVKTSVAKRRQPNQRWCIHDTERMVCQQYHATVP